MDKTGKFLLPSPKFEKLDKSPTPHFLSPQGMLLPKEKQPPPMYGARGSTIPPKFLDPQRVPTASHSQQDRVQKYFCEPCEAEFHTSTDYKVHRNEHTPCEIDNCSFRGHPSFMDTHIAQQHATGLYDQLKKLSTPEEIACWRAERKKNYPTVASVEQKRKAHEQRMKRGEKLEGNKKRFGRQDDRRQMRTDNKKDTDKNTEKLESKKRQRKKHKGLDKKPIKNADKKTETVSTVLNQEDEEITSGSLKMFKGTSRLVGYKKVKKIETHALSTLLGMYGSGSDDESSNDEEEDEHSAPMVEESKEEISKSSFKISQEEVPHIDESINSTSQCDQSTNQEIAQPSSEVSLRETVSHYENPMDESASQQNVENPTNKPTEQHSSEDEVPEEAPIAKASSIPEKPQHEPPQKKMKRDPTKIQAPKSGLDYKKLRVGRQNTMLEKLLEPDIRHERNVLLQCVRFVVENNFFGIGSSASQTPS